MKKGFDSETYLKVQTEKIEERIEMFEKLSNDEKGSVESYDWGEDLGKEILK